MSKKYRLDIPNIFRGVVYANILEMQGKLIYEGPISTGQMLVDGYYIPLEWLQEIKDGYINSPDEYLKSKYPDNYSDQYIKSSGYFESDMWLAFREGEKNDRKRTQPLIDEVEMVLEAEPRYTHLRAALQQLKEQDNE